MSNNEDLAVTKRPNFPLPRELRDQIYGYLLHHEHTKAAPYQRPLVALTDYAIKSSRVKSTAHTFRFHADILATNHHIREEALKVLVSNHFVMVSFKWNALQVAKHIHGLPIVCEDQKAVAKFKDHHLKVNIHHGHKGLRTGTSGKGRSFLMLAVDLPLFCGEMMRWELLMAPSPDNILVHLRDSPPNKLHIIKQNLDGVHSVVTTKIQLRSTEGSPMDTALETRLLDPFQSMIANSLRVEIMDSLQPEKSRALAELMGPRLVFLKPMSWLAVEVAQNIKRSADELVVQGDFDRALAKYHMVMDAQEAYRLLSSPPEVWRSDSGIPLGLLQRIVMDAAVTASFI